MLLMGAGLLLQSLVRLQRVNPGFQPQNVLTFRVSLPATRYGSAAKTSLFFQQLLAHLKQLPGGTARTRIIG